MPNPKDTPNPYGHPVYQDWAKKSPYDRVYDLMHAHGTASEGPVCDLFSCHTFPLCLHDRVFQNIEKRGGRELACSALNLMSDIFCGPKNE